MASQEGITGVSVPEIATKEFSLPFDLRGVQRTWRNFAGHENCASLGFTALALGANEIVSSEKAAYPFILYFVARIGMRFGAADRLASENRGFSGKFATGMGVALVVGGGTLETLQQYFVNSQGDWKNLAWYAGGTAIAAGLSWFSFNKNKY